MKIERLTVMFCVRDRLGILFDVASVFLEFKINIHTVTTSEQSINGLNLVTIETFSSKKYIENILVKLAQIKGVINCSIMKESELIFKRVALFKFNTDTFFKHPSFQEILETNQAQIVEINRETIIIVKVGEEYEIENFYEKVSQYNPLQYSISSRATVSL